MQRPLPPLTLKAPQAFRRTLLSALVGMTCLALSLQTHAETLAQAWDTAQAQDHQLKAKQQLTLANHQQVKIAEDAYFPIIDLNAGYTLFDSAPASKINGNAMQVGEDKILSYGASLTLPLYTHGKITSAVAQAEQQYQQTQMDEQAQRQTLKLSVAQAYIQVLSAQKYLTLAQHQHGYLYANRMDVENLYAEGIANKNDLLTAKVALVGAEQQILKSKNALNLAKANYNRLLGRPFNASVSLDELEFQSQGQNIDQLIAQAQTQRSEVRSLQAQIQAMHAAANLVLADNGPQVALKAGYQYQQNKYQVNEGQWSASVGASWRIFDAHINRRMADKTLNQANSVQQNLLEIQSQIALQVHQAWLNLQEASSRIQVTQVAIDQAAENLKITRERYLAGLAQNTEVLDATTLKKQSDIQYLQAIYDALLADFALKRALGTL